MAPSLKYLLPPLLLRGDTSHVQTGDATATVILHVELVHVGQLCEQKKVKIVCTEQ